MFRKNWLRLTILLPAIVCLAGISAFAQRNRLEREERALSCNDNWGGDRPSHCVIKEQTIPASGGMISVDGKKNGGISVKGWDRGEIHIRAKIQAWADTEAEAQAITGHIVETGHGHYAIINLGHLLGVGNQLFPGLPLRREFQPGLFEHALVRQHRADFHVILILESEELAFPNIPV